jgi:hypothetical protein
MLLSASWLCSRFCVWVISSDENGGLWVYLGFRLCVCVCVCVCVCFVQQEQLDPAGKPEAYSGFASSVCPPGKIPHTLWACQLSFVERKAAKQQTTHNTNQNSHSWRLFHSWNFVWEIVDPSFLRAHPNSLLANPGHSCLLLNECSSADSST